MALAVAGVAILLLAYWLRNPLLPYGDAGSRASGFSPQSESGSDAARRRIAALSALQRKVTEATAILELVSAQALDAPADADAAFASLRGLPPGPEFGVVLYENGAPVAWGGQIKTDPSSAAEGTSVQLTPFYAALDLARRRGPRTAVATVLLHAEAPADRLSAVLFPRAPERGIAESFTFSPLADTAGGEVIRSGGRRLFRVDATPLQADVMRFARTARLRGHGILALSGGLILFVLVAWSDRRNIARKAFAILIAAISIAIVPWSNFSNTARVFDPAYFYWRPGAPFTANAGVFLLSGTLLVLGAFALIRARKSGIPRFAAGVASVVLASGGLALAAAASSGIAVPPSGSTIALWLSWELPLFLLLFACWLTAFWLARIAGRRGPAVHLRAAAVMAMLSGLVAASMTWRTVTQDRLELATRDISGLQRADEDASLLLRRFGVELSAHDSPGGRPDLLKRYAASDIAAADLQISLSAWTAAGIRTSELQLAPLPYDSLVVAAAVEEALTSAEPVIRQVVGPTGRQLILATAHRGEGVTSAVVSPHTRLVGQDPFAALLGFGQPVEGEQPYGLTLADVPESSAARPAAIRWRRIGDEWHGDQLIDTSRGVVRAHAEVDLRSWVTRLVRGSLVVLLDIAIAAFLWTVGAMTEGGFARWAKARGRTWMRSYRGRLTLVFFAFFVVPAMTFAAWSYQRLRGDDRDVREILVRETLPVAAGSDPASPAHSHAIGETPLFVYSGAILRSSSDSLYEMMAPNGRVLPPSVQLAIAGRGELTASTRHDVGGSRVLWGYRAASGPGQERYVLAAPSRSDELALDRRRRDLTLLVLFATAIGGLAALWLSGIAGRILARDLEMSRIEVARAERVLAWGEMARQVAHEIKNPLTPIRLGVQHLRRARSDPRVDFDKVLDDNVTRILSEIDRLDEIARAFTRYGAAPADLPPAERIDVASILRDVVALEKMGVGEVSWTLRGSDDTVYAMARGDELRDVLLNVFENARLARARHVGVSLAREHGAAVIEITDDGAGISHEALPRVFEPHFSTRTTGSGLGLAISRRLLESWRGTIELASEEGKGARVVITLQATPE